MTFKWPDIQLAGLAAPTIGLHDLRNDSSLKEIYSSRVSAQESAQLSGMGRLLAYIKLISWPW